MSKKFYVLEEEDDSYYEVLSYKESTFEMSWLEALKVCGACELPAYVAPVDDNYNIKFVNKAWNATHGLKL